MPTPNQKLQQYRQSIPQVNKIEDPNTLQILRQIAQNNSSTISMKNINDQKLQQNQFVGQKRTF